MKGQVPLCQFNSPIPMRFTGRCGGDSRMLEMYCEYADIAAADEPLGRIKARLAALSAFAESQGLTGHAAFDGLRRLTADMQGELMETRRFSLFYRFVFFMCRERGQKSISVNTAVDAWRLSLTGRFRLLDQWCAFVQTHQRHSISEDTWRQVLEFSRSVHEDLSNYDREGAWPVLVDEFVDNMYRKSSCSVCSLEPTILCGCGVDLLTKLSSDDDSAAKTLTFKATTLPGMVASAGSKRRRRDPKDEAAQAESVNSIAQLFAEMPSPLSCKRVRSTGCLVEVQDPMEEIFELNHGLWGHDLSNSVDDEMASGSIHGSPSGSQRPSNCDVFSPLVCQPWPKFDGRGSAAGSCVEQPLCPNSLSQDSLNSVMKHSPIMAVSRLPYF